MQVKRRTSSEKSRKYWEAIDRVVKSEDNQKKQIRVGESWTDSRRDLSASLVVDLPSK